MAVLLCLLRIRTSKRNKRIFAKEQFHMALVRENGNIVFCFYQLTSGFLIRREKELFLCLSPGSLKLATFQSDLI